VGSRLGRRSHGIGRRGGAPTGRGTRGLAGNAQA
jgi:hypothetical protein